MPSWQEHCAAASDVVIDWSPGPSGTGDLRVGTLSKLASCSQTDMQLAYAAQCQMKLVLKECIEFYVFL